MLEDMTLCEANQASFHDKRNFFVQMHYPAPERYDGFCSLYIKQGDGKFKTLVCRHMSEFPKFVRKIDFHKADYYLAANSFRKPKRSSRNLFSLNNIVIDIDCHYFSYKKEKQMRAAMNRLFTALAEWEDDVVPKPNTVVSTGRGVQVWWKVEQAAAAISSIYEAVVEYFIDALENLIRNMGISNFFNVDSACSRNKAGLFRMPGTYNTKSHTYGRVMFVSEDEINLYEYYSEVVRKDLNLAWKSAAFNPMALQDVTPQAVALARRRADALFKLQKIRQDEGVGAGEELRDLFLLCLASVTNNVYDQDEQLELCAKMNSLFIKPLEERKWKKYISTCLRKKYMITNARIIDFLAITDKEQDLIGLHPYTGGSAVDREAAKKEAEKKRRAKKRRDKSIVKFANDGMDKQDIAEQVGVTAMTVGNVLKKLGVKTWSEKRRAQIRHLISVGLPARRIASLCGVSFQAVYYNINKMAQEEAAIEAAAMQKAKESQKIWDDKFNFAKSCYDMFGLEVPVDMYVNMHQSVPLEVLLEKRKEPEADAEPDTAA